MMRTRRSLFVFGVLLAVGVLLAPQATFAQTTPSNVKLAAGTPAHSSITVTWSPGDSTVATYEVEWKKIADGATPTAGDANVDTPPPPRLSTKRLAHQDPARPSAQLPAPTPSWIWMPQRHTRLRFVG